MKKTPKGQSEILYARNMKALLALLIGRQVFMVGIQPHPLYTHSLKSLELTNYYKSGVLVTTSDGKDEFFVYVPSGDKRGIKWLKPIQLCNAMIHSNHGEVLARVNYPFKF